MVQLEPGGPSFDASGQAGQVLRGKGRPVEVAEELLGLPGTEAQIVGAYLEEFAVEAQAGDVDVGRRREVAARQKFGGK